MQIFRVHGSKGRLIVSPFVIMILILCFVMAVPRLTKASDEKAQESEAAARKIVGSAVAAMGGTAALGQVKSISMLGMTHVWVGAQEIEGAAKYTYLRPNKYRVDVDLPQMKIIQAYNGKLGWGLENLRPYPREIDERVAISMQVALTRGFLALFHVESPKTKMSMVSREDVEGVKADVVDFDDGMGNVTRFYFDISSHLPVRVVYSDIDPQGNPIVTTDVFMNFRKVGSLLWPHRVVEYQADQKKRDDIFTEIQVNGKVPESFFDPINP
jgi:hypothetical protein